jgi:pantetheine-phosphate adenylyltransferase
MVRIIGGQARGRRLVVPDGPVRPTADRVREAIFNVLEHRLGVALEGARVLDLFAGAGTLGLEAYSRGAASVCLVEGDRRVADALAGNARRVDPEAGARIRVVNARVERFLAGVATPFDLVFLDPPYDAGAAAPALESLVRGGWLAPGAVVLVEHRAGDAPAPPEGLATAFERRYGDTGVIAFSQETPMRVALYPGSFDPITNGHVDIVRRALKLFDRVVVAVACNIRKTPLFADADRVAMIEEVFAGEGRVEVATFSGLLVEYARQRGIPTVIRGLRAVSDFEYEFQMASMNRRLADEVDSIFMMTGEDHFYLSSSLIREVAANGGDVSGFVPPNVEARLRARFHAST